MRRLNVHGSCSALPVIAPALLVAIPLVLGVLAGAELSPSGALYGVTAAGGRGNAGVLYRLGG